MKAGENGEQENEKTRLRLLAVEPYYGGSHRAFLDGWRAASRHGFTVVDLPASKWKWRMRHAAWTCAEKTRELLDTGARFDAVFASDMLNLAEFRGLVPPAVAALPAVAYFHENQLTYPLRFREEERDLHFAMTNFTTALAACRVWFNSRFHRDDFLDALAAFLKRMPDFRPLDAVEEIRRRSAVQPQGIHPAPERGTRQPGPLRILWAARWEHDKNPELFFAAVDALDRRSPNGKANVRLSVVGEQFRDVPEVFAEARERFADRVDRWGYQPRREDYMAALREADVFVSTAGHEFFGVSAAEAMAAGCFPLLPDRLAYPELLAGLAAEERREHFYDGTADALARRLAELVERISDGEDPWQGTADAVRRCVAGFAWPCLGPRLDDALVRAVIH